MKYIMFLPVYAISVYGIIRSMIDENIYSIMAWGFLLVTISIFCMSIKICETIKKSTREVKDERIKMG